MKFSCDAHKYVWKVWHLFSKDKINVDSKARLARNSRKMC